MWALTHIVTVCCSNLDKSFPLVHTYMTAMCRNCYVKNQLQLKAPTEKQEWSMAEKHNWLPTAAGRAKSPSHTLEGVDWCLQVSHQLACALNTGFVSSPPVPSGAEAFSLAEVFTAAAARASKLNQTDLAWQVMFLPHKEAAETSLLPELVELPTQLLGLMQSLEYQNLLSFQDTLI